MNRIEEKLEHFANDVLADVYEEKRVLVEKVDEELRLLFKEKEDESMARALEIIQEALAYADQKKSESLSRIVMRNRTRLFEKRSEIFEGIYSKTIERLVAFKETEAYKTLLIEKVNESKNLLGEGEISVKLDYSDRSLKVFLEEATACSVLIESKKVQLIGGCIVCNNTTNTIVDSSFAIKLEHAKSGFAQQCQLEID